VNDVDGLDILLDVDGVIYPFPELFTTWLAARLDRPLELDTTAWAFYACWGLDDEDFLGHLVDGVREQDLWWTGDPYPDVVATFDRLHERGHRIHLVTARDVAGAEAGLAATEHWLAVNDLEVASVNLAQDKPTVLERLDLDVATCVAVDDGPHHVEAWERAGVYGVVMNRWGSYQGDHRCVSDLAGFADHLDDLRRLRPAS
jgi:beta-phosphoglucomutase-like phosphatase (HAD superfamily)